MWERHGMAWLTNHSLGAVHAGRACTGGGIHDGQDPAGCAQRKPLELLAWVRSNHYACATLPVAVAHPCSPRLMRGKNLDADEFEAVLVACKALAVR